MPRYMPDCHDSPHPFNLSIESGSYFPPHYHYLIMASQVALVVKNLLSMQERTCWSLGWKIPWRRKRQLTPILLPGKFRRWFGDCLCSLGRLQAIGSQRVETTEATCSPLHYLILVSLSLSFFFWSNSYCPWHWTLVNLITSLSLESSVSFLCPNYRTKFQLIILLYP